MGQGQGQRLTKAGDSDSHEDKDTHTNVPPSAPEEGAWLAFDPPISPLR